MKGIQKLKIALIFILIIEIVALMISMIGTDLANDEMDEFIDRLTYDEQITLTQLYNKYPEEKSTDMYTMGGYLIWASIIMTAFLLFKVWNKERID